MKKLLLITMVALSCLFLNACASNEIVHKSNGIQSLGKCRITFYNAHEDKFGSKVASPYIPRAIIGTTVAAHPSFPFNSWVYIPELKDYVGSSNFRVDDRGKWVTSMKASHGQTYVFDVYVGTKKFMKKMEWAVPKYLDVYAVNRYNTKQEITSF